MSFSNETFSTSFGEGFDRIDPPAVITVTVAEGLFLQDSLSHGIYLQSDLGSDIYLQGELKGDVYFQGKLH